MWKYSCKSQLKILLIAFLIGIGMMMLTFSSSEAVYREIFQDEVVDFMYQNLILTYLLGGISIAALANSVILVQMLMRKFQFGIFLILAVLVLQPTIIVEVGCIGLIPSVIVFIYGALSLDGQMKKQMKEYNINKESDLVEIYKSRHTLREDVRPLAEEIRKNNDKLNGIYLLGIIALICIMMFISNFLILVLAFFFYTYAFTYLNRYKMANLLPLRTLLYENCDPEACASAVIYYSNKHNRFKCKDHALLAQSLIYLDDPDLADMFLITYPRSSTASNLTYLTLKSYIYYLKKDETKLLGCKNEAGKIRLSYGPTGVQIQSGEVLAIQNKINLLNGDFNTCRKYYLGAYQTATFNFQRVDASYYIALISFVLEDYVVAKTYFEKVVSKGNKMCFVAKAQKYLDKINKLEISEEVSE